jgi:hypothetical protein
MPPLRRSIDLAEACEFLGEVAASSPTAQAKANGIAASPAIEPADLRVDLSSDEAMTIRTFFSCSVCDAKVTERCRDNGATSAFLHEARVRAAVA